MSAAEVPDELIAGLELLRLLPPQTVALNLTMMLIVASELGIIDDAVFVQATKDIKGWSDSYVKIVVERVKAASTN